MSNSVLFLDFLDRRAFRRGVRILVADKAGRKLDAAAVRRHARLIDEDHLPVVFGKDHNRVDVVGAACVFPFAPPQRAHEPAAPHNLGLRQIVELHSSISLSGISLMSSAPRGKCSASTAPTRSTAATIPSPGRPSRKCSIRTCMASPQT